MLTLITTLAWSQPAASPVPIPTPEAAVAWAQWEQQSLPAWQRRQATAEAELKARQAFFAGEVPFEAAFRELVEARLFSLPVVRGRLDALQREASQREAERLEPLELGEQTEEARQVRQAALDAEARADEPLRLLLSRTEAFLTRNPQLADEALADRVRVEQVELPADPARRQEAEARAAADDARQAAWRRLQREAWENQVRGGPAPDASADLALLDTPRSREAADRLRRGIAFWSDPAAVETALESWSQGPAAERANAALEAAKSFQIDDSLDDNQVEDAVEAARQEVIALQARIDALDEEDPRRAYLPTELQAAQLRLASFEARLAAVKEARDEERQASAAAAKARAEADAAQAAAVDEDAKERARLLTAAADASDRLAALTQQVHDAEAAVEKAEAEHADELQEYQALVEQAEQSSSLVRINELDSKYAKLRGRLIDLERSELARGAGVVEAEKAVDEVERAVQADLAMIRRAPESMDTTDWSQSLDRELAVAQELLAVANRVYTEHLAHIRHLADQRRTLRAYADVQQQNADLATSTQEVRLELQIMVTSLGTLALARLDQIIGFPARLIGNGRMMADITMALLWLLVLLGAWSWARGKAGVLAARLGMQLRRFRADLRPLDLQRLKHPLETAIRAGIDLGLGYLMMGRISELSGEIGFLVQCWLLLAIYRFLLALFDLAVVRAPEFRPSVVALSPAAFDRVRTSAQIVFVWGIAKGFTFYLCWTILGMDAVTNLLMLVFNLLGLALLVVIGHRLYPMLLERIRARNQESRLVALLSRQVPWPLQAPAALGMLFFFLATVFSDVWHFLLAYDRTGLARVFNVVSRYQMDEATSIQGPRTDLREQLVGTDLGDKVHVEREELNSVLATALDEWRAEKRRGLIALVGDRGTGKRTEIARFLKRVPDAEIPVHRHRLRGEVLTSAAVFQEIATLAGIEPTADPEEMIERLRPLKRSVLVLEQAHRTFTRSVGGFEAIQDLLYVMNATSDQHLWLVSVHGPAWAYLASIPAIVDVGVFRTVAKLEAFTAPMLRELCENRSKAAGQQLDYTSLMRNNLLGADPQVELERATNTFYRLLAESSGGNPRVALHLFADSLEQVDEHRCRVHTTKALGTDVVTDLSVEALFILVAVRQQDAMYLPEIGEVTNLPLHTVRNLIRDLQGRGLIEQAAEQLYIPIVELPRVTRTLKRRHLMHLGT